MPMFLRFSSLNVLSLLWASLAFAAPPLEPQRQLFTQAEQAIKQGRSADFAGLADYPLWPYLQYQKLDRDLNNRSAIADFLARYPQTRQAMLLRQHWSDSLAEQNAWAEIVANYRDTEHSSTQCWYGVALAQVNRQPEAFALAEKLWSNGANLPNSCERLFSLWQASPRFTVEHIWRRFGLALQKDNTVLANRLQNLLPSELQPQATLWRQVHEQPRLVLACSTLNPATPVAGRIFAHGIDRLASDDPVLAQTAWDLHKNRFTLAAEEIARIDRRTALALAAQRRHLALAYLLELPASSADAQTRAWRVRAALAQQDWSTALAAITLLNPDEQNQAQWRYWRARALEATGDAAQAQNYYRLAAQERDFYGFNAADRIGAEYPLTSRPLAVTETELDQLANTPPFAAIHEWLALNRDNEARSEWLYAIKSLAAHELQVAAKLAQRWGLHNLAIMTIAKTGEWDDLALRFPLAYRDEILQAAQAQQLDPVLVYALTRRESAFDPNAGSSVGAMGLMQLMPATGQMMAQRLGETLPRTNALLEPRRNLRYGAAYLRGLLDKFNQQFALAAAAYNAGPNRIDRWLPNGQTWSADLWIETIPFSETRQYVAAVLSHAVMYQNQLNLASRRISELLPDVSNGNLSSQQDERTVSVPFCE